MTLLEKLKELSATTGRRNEGEDLGHWADREKHENAWVRDVALPALIEVVEAAKAYRKAQERALEIEGAGPGFSERLWEGRLATAQDAEEIMKNNLDAALAKLEVEA